MIDYDNFTIFVKVLMEKENQHIKNLKIEQEKIYLLVINLCYNGLIGEIVKGYNDFQIELHDEDEHTDCIEKEIIFISSICNAYADVTFSNNGIAIEKVDIKDNEDIFFYEAAEIVKRKLINYCNSENKVIVASNIQNLGILLDQNIGINQESIIRTLKSIIPLQQETIDFIKEICIDNTRIELIEDFVKNGKLDNNKLHTNYSGAKLVKHLSPLILEGKIKNPNLELNQIIIARIIANSFICKNKELKIKTFQNSISEYIPTHLINSKLNTLRPKAI